MKIDNVMRHYPLLLHTGSVRFTFSGKVWEIKTNMGQSIYIYIYFFLITQSSYIIRIMYSILTYENKIYISDSLGQILFNFHLSLASRHSQ
jgi:hypothetical protein